MPVAFGQKGAIVCIRLRNFMTYEDVTLHPAGNLNLIIGPNGAGKSALVCAIIVGLAGEVSLTGRATNIVSLVRRGSNWASTFIELWGERGNYTIERKIFITSREEGKIEQRSEWILNGKTVTMRDIRNLTKELNIKVDNLCQFLPQDSVASFVKMSNSELLVNTLKATGDNQLVEDLNKLSELTKDISEQTLELGKLEQSIKENEINARRLETEVERLKEREHLDELKKLCRKKIIYIKYTEAVGKHRAIEEDLKSKQHELSQVERRSEPQKRAAEINRSEVARLSEYIGNCNDSRRAVATSRDKLINDIDDLQIRRDEAYTVYQNKSNEEASRASKLQIAKQELDGYECRHNELRDIDHTSELSKLDLQIQKRKSEMAQRNSKSAALNDMLRDQVIKIENAKRDLDEMQQIKKKKLGLIQRFRPDLYKVVDWLCSHRDKFKQQVYLPMFVEIDVIESSDSDLVESAIGDSERWSFVCQNEHDLKYLTRAARHELNVGINVIMPPDRTMAEFERETSALPDFPKENFRAFMKDLVSAEEPIMRILYGMSNFHTLPIFTKDTTERELKTLSERLRRFYIDRNFYSISRSKYDGELMTSIDVVHKARDLIYSLDKARLRDLHRIYTSSVEQKRALEDEQKLAREEYDQIEKGLQSLLKQHQHIRNQQDEKLRVRAMLEKTRSKISELESTRIDIGDEKRKLQQKIKEVNRQSIAKLNKLRDVNKDYANLIKSICLNDLLRTSARRNLHLAKKKYERAMLEAKQLRSTLEHLRSQLGDMEKTVSEAKAHAEAKIRTFSDGKIDKQTQKKFDMLAEENLEDLEARYDELEARIQGIIRDPTNSIMTDYQHQTTQLRDKNARITALKISLAKLIDVRDKTKESFMPGLNGVISNIDHHYQNFMRMLKYDGNIELDSDPEDMDNFSDYGIRILVRYHEDEKLIALSSTRQSGGERSVATMIYMLALQTQTTVPFRVVDEINQGMDQDNERKVFDLLVRTADESSSQYLLVSPKLLSGLEYSDKMQVHVIMNGPGVKFDFNKFMTYSAD